MKKLKENEHKKRNLESIPYRNRIEIEWNRCYRRVKLNQKSSGDDPKTNEQLKCGGNSVVQEISRVVQKIVGYSRKLQELSSNY